MPLSGYNPFPNWPVSRWCPDQSERVQLWLHHEGLGKCVPAVRIWFESNVILFSILLTECLTDVDALAVFHHIILSHLGVSQLQHFSCHWKDFSSDLSSFGPFEDLPGLGLRIHLIEESFQLEKYLRHWNRCCRDGIVFICLYSWNPAKVGWSWSGCTGEKLCAAQIWSTDREEIGRETFLLDLLTLLYITKFIPLAKMHDDDEPILFGGAGLQGKRERSSYFSWERSKRKANWGWWKFVIKSLE